MPEKVPGGAVVTALARKKGVKLIPIDSEHSAIFQCLQGEESASVDRLILTASGGPFRAYSDEQLEAITPDEALKHPTWTMGPKVTIDSSTLMNKGLEVIEAYWLFGIPVSKIDVVIHPQSIIHSMVEFVDGSIKAQMGEPDMILPIQYALTYPSRRVGMFQPFDFMKHPTLSFSVPDTDRFRCLGLAFEALRQGDSFPCYLNAANEVLVQRFLSREIPWKDIGKRLEKLLERHRPEKELTLDKIMSIDTEARQEAGAIN